MGLNHRASVPDAKFALVSHHGPPMQRTFLVVHHGEIMDRGIACVGRVVTCTQPGDRGLTQTARLMEVGRSQPLPLATLGRVLPLVALVSLAEVGKLTLISKTTNRPAGGDPAPAKTLGRRQLLAENLGTTRKQVGAVLPLPHGVDSEWDPLPAEELEQSIEV